LLHLQVYPIALKLTIELDGQLAADQYYALGCTIQTINTGEKREEDSTKGEGVVKFGGAASTSFFSWETSAVDEADAVVPVVASSVVSAGTVDEIDPATMKNDKAYKRNIYFTFAAAGVSHILWDPQVSWRPLNPPTHTHTLTHTHIRTHTHGTHAHTRNFRPHSHVSICD